MKSSNDTHGDEIGGRRDREIAYETAYLLALTIDRTVDDDGQAIADLYCEGSIVTLIKTAILQTIIESRRYERSLKQTG